MVTWSAAAAPALYLCSSLKQEGRGKGTQLSSCERRRIYSGRTAVLRDITSYISLVRTGHAWPRESKKSILFCFYSFNSRDRPGIWKWSTDKPTQQCLLQILMQWDKCHSRLTYKIIQKHLRGQFIIPGGSGGRVL